MCGRYEFKSSAKNLNAYFPGLSLTARDVTPRDEILPTETVLALTSGARGFFAFHARWGLVGGFLDAVPSTAPLINLCSEGLAVKPFYGRLLRQKRCILPATAYFEWGKPTRGERQKMRISDPQEKPLWLAGVFDHHPKIGLSCAILTTEASENVRTLHGRMPLLLNRESAKFWLAEHEDFPVDDYHRLIEQAAQTALKSKLCLEPKPSPQLSFAFA